MSSKPVPQSLPYRISLFYGPETVDGSPPRQRCVFNVKKRSWRTGVQVAVEVTNAQVIQAKILADYSPWVATVLKAVPDDEREEYRSRAEELLVQSLCSLKLELAIEGSLAQENQTLGASVLSDELTRALPSHLQRLRSHILAELDVAV